MRFIVLFFVKVCIFVKEKYFIFIEDYFFDINIGFIYEFEYVK